MTKEINLTAYAVEYVDMRDEKPKVHHTERFVIDGGRISSLRRLGLGVRGFIVQRYAAEGFGVVSMQKEAELTGSVDLSALWYKAAAARDMDAMKKLPNQTEAAEVQHDV